MAAPQAPASNDKVLANLPVPFPEFSGLPGTTSFSDFFDVFQAKANGRGYNEQQTGTALMAFLTGPALSFVNGLPDQNKSTYKDLIKALADRFDLSEQQAMRALAKARQKPLEAAEQFAERVSRLVNRAYAEGNGYKADLREKIKIKSFVSGLRKDTKKVLDRQPAKFATLDQAIQAARNEERLQEEEQHLEELSRDQIDELIKREFRPSNCNYPDSTLHKEAANDPISSAAEPPIRRNVATIRNRRVLRRRRLRGILTILWTSSTPSLPDDTVSVFNRCREHGTRTPVDQRMHLLPTSGAIANRSREDATSTTAADHMSFPADLPMAYDTPTESALKSHATGQQSLSRSRLKSSRPS
uniref:Retrotrans_gag domain-containing protein n=1 Tax=Steinernema glaseri TaxID=37863 RepID=A0A1I7Z876_9BILA